MYIRSRVIFFSAPFSLVFISSLLLVISSAIPGLNNLTSAGLGHVSNYVMCLPIGAAAIACTSALFGWFGLSDEDPLFSAFYNLRHDRVSVWFLIGIAWAAFLAISSFWVTEEYMGIAAQHLEGTSSLVRGVVVESHHVVTPRSECRHDLMIQEAQTDRRIAICLYTSRRGMLSDRIPSIGSKIDLYVRQTTLGRVALSIKIDD